MAGWQSRKKKGVCPRCGGQLKDTKTCRNCLDRMSEQNLQLKMEAFRFYGEECLCCGEVHQAFLSIDHVDNNGAEPRKLPGGPGKTMYRWLKKQGYPTGFRVLCHNCNLGRHINGGVCPHQEILGVVGPEGRW